MPYNYTNTVANQFAEHCAHILNVLQFSTYFQLFLKITTTYFQLFLKIVRKANVYKKIGSNISKKDYDSIAIE